MFVKKSVVAFFSALILVSCTSRFNGDLNVNEQKIKSEVQASFERLVEVSKSLDTKAYFNLIDKDKFVGLNADGTNWNDIDGLKSLIEPGFAAVKRVVTLEFPNVRISVIDENTAILVNEYEQTIELADGSQFTQSGGGTQVWSKASGNWLLVSISASNKAS